MTITQIVRVKPFLILTITHKISTSSYTEHRDGDGDGVRWHQCEWSTHLRVH